MALFLVQHGISAHKEIDPEKGLTDHGKTETERIAGVAKGYGIRVARIIHSGKKRARQTAEILQNILAVDMRTAGAVFKPVGGTQLIGEHLTACSSPNLVWTNVA